MENLKNINWNLVEVLNIDSIIENAVNDGINNFEHPVSFEVNGIEYSADVEINVSIDELVEYEGIIIYNREYSLNDVDLTITNFCLDDYPEDITLKNKINIENELTNDFKLFFN